jgi:uncharacterized C2H2 Zn-finger protein
MPPIRHRSYWDIVLRDSAHHLPDLPAPVTPPTPSREPSAPPFLEMVLEWSPAPSPPPPKKRATGNKVRKPYRCDLCPMVFQRPGALDQHQNKHTGAKRAYVSQWNAQLTKDASMFVCENCGSAFSYKTNLTRHRHGCPQEDGPEEVSPIGFIL